ncbi:MAG: putative lipid II flippase FtsW [Candidatus Saganbacteria bacterium]|nr:putative lipid II flippase FtsW [Candidatus Saganbacteria bacterium]
MNNRIAPNKKRPDFLFVFLLSLLLFVGIILVFSSSCAMALKNTGDSFFYVKRHIFYVLVGLLAFYFAYHLDLSKLRKRSFFLLLGAFLFSLLVFVPAVGKSMGGAARWINLLGISIQPSEILKLAIIIFLAHLLAKQKEKLSSFFSGLLPLLLIVLFAVFPVLMQPDFGTTLTILFVAFFMFYISGAELSHLAILFLTGGVTAAGLSIMSPYRLRRMLSFLDPWADPLGAGYQIIQSHIAISSGHLFGLGLGNSKQKFLYLPQQYSDFIFAIMCEELGLIGAVIFLALLLFFLIRGFIISSRPSDYYLSILGAGIVFMFAIQAFLNIAVVLGLLPTTGLPLPFISYGGTAIVVNLFGAGIVANISKR